MEWNVCESIGCCTHYLPLNFGLTHGPLIKYEQSQVVHAPGMRGFWLQTKLWVKWPWHASRHVRDRYLTRGPWPWNWMFGYSNSNFRISVFPEWIVCLISNERAINRQHDIYCEWPWPSTLHGIHDFYKLFRVAWVLSYLKVNWLIAMCSLATCS